MGYSSLTFSVLMLISDRACARRPLCNTNSTISKHFSVLMMKRVSQQSVNTSKVSSFLSSLVMIRLTTWDMDSVFLMAMSLLKRLSIKREALGCSWTDIASQFHPRLVGVHSQVRCERERNLGYDYKLTCFLLS
jgi:hypothetical protein